MDIKNIKSLQREDCIRFEEFDIKYNIDTFGFRKVIWEEDSWQVVPKQLINDNIVAGSQGYQPSALVWVEMLNDAISSLLDHTKYKLVDIGCGKGKPFFYTISRGFKYRKFVGIEADKGLYEICQNNLSTFNIKHNCDIEILHINALDYDYSEENSIYFLFNPFSKDIFDELINKNIEKLKGKKSYFAFLFEQDYRLEKMKNFKLVYDNHPITIYEIVG